MQWTASGNAQRLKVVTGYNNIIIEKILNNIQVAKAGRQAS